MMTKEERELVYKELCARLPYRTFVSTYSYQFNEGSLELLTPELIKIYNRNESLEIKPYLRPLSSITEEEAKYLFLLHNKDRKECEILRVSIDKNYIDFEIDDGCCSFERHTIWFEDVVASIESLDWLNTKHFDYRGLIEKGLALEQLKEMYK